MVHDRGATKSRRAQQLLMAETKAPLSSQVGGTMALWISQHCDLSIWVSLRWVNTGLVFPRHLSPTHRTLFYDGTIWTPHHDKPLWCLFPSAPHTPLPQINIPAAPTPLWKKRQQAKAPLPNLNCGGAYSKGPFLVLSPPHPRGG